TRARRNGLRTRPMAVTISDILEAGIPERDDKRRIGTLARERERDLLAVWRLQKAGLALA
ncbi:MAG: hypothetical protein M3Q28_09855, partial [Pseudomonadota bacterium]|nr:hypothetical protein [Pseudomonadota bacterium]